MRLFRAGQACLTGRAGLDWCLEIKPKQGCLNCVLGQSPSSLTGHLKLQGHSTGVEFFSAEKESRSVSVKARYTQVEVSIAKKKQLKMLL